MKANQAVREIMKAKDIGTNALAKLLGKAPRLVSDRLSQETITTAKLAEMLNKLDYQIVLVPKGSDLPSGSLQIEQPED